MQMSENQLSFEVLLERLQSMVTQLESEELGLEASLKLYEEGTSLSTGSRNFGGCRGEGC